MRNSEIIEIIYATRLNNRISHPFSNPFSLVSYVCEPGEVENECMKSKTFGKQKTKEESYFPKVIFYFSYVFLSFAAGSWFIFISFPLAFCFLSFFLFAKRYERIRDRKQKICQRKLKMNQETVDNFPKTILAADVRSLPLSLGK